MAEDLTLTLKGKDQLSSVVKRAGADFTKTANQMRDSLGRFTAGAKTSTNSVGSLTAALHKVPSAASAVSASLRSVATTANTSLGATRSMLDGVRSSADSLTATFRNTGLAVGAMLGAVTAGIAKTGLDLNKSVGEAQMGLTQVLGSSRAAAAAIAALREEARTTKPTFAELLGPFMQLTQSFKAISGVARAPQDALRVLRAFGDAGVVSAGGNIERITGALYGLRQMMGRPLVQMEEVGQIAENLNVNVADILKKRFGSTNTEDLQGMGVTGAMAAQAIIEGFEKEFGGAQIRLARTGTGLQSSIEDWFNDQTGRVTTGLGQKMTEALGGLFDTLNKFSESARGNGLLDGLTLAFTNFGSALVGAVSKVPGILNQVIPLISGFVQTMGSLVKGIAELAGSQKLISGLVAPFHAVGNALQIASASAGGFTKWLEQIVNQGTVTAFFSTVAALVQTIGERLLKLVGIDLNKMFSSNNVLNFFSAMYQGIEGGIKGFYGLGRVVNELGRILISMWEDVSDKIGDVFADMTTWMGRTFIDGTAGFRKMVSEWLSNLRTAVEAAYNVMKPFRDMLSQAGKALLDALGGVNSFLGNAIKGLQGNISAMFKSDAATLQRYQFEDTVTAASRKMRSGYRMEQDPYRKDPFGKRIADAFRGRGVNGDLDAQNAFFRDLAKNYTNISGLFQSSAPALPAGPAVNPNMAPATGLYGMGPQWGDVRRGTSVTPVRPSIFPALPRPDSSFSGFSDASGRSYIQGQGMAPPTMTADQVFASQQQRGRSTVTRTAGQIIININGASPEQVKQQVLGIIDEEYRGQDAGPKGSY